MKSYIMLYSREAGLIKDSFGGFGPDQGGQTAAGSHPTFK